MDPIKAYKLCFEDMMARATASRGASEDVGETSTNRKPIKRNRSEEESPKDNPKKASRIGEGSDAGALISTSTEPNAEMSQMAGSSATEGRSFRDVLTNIQIGVRNKEPMSDEQLTLVKRSILRAVIEAPKGETTPKLEACAFKPGWLLIIVKEEYSLKWLKRKIASIKPWPEADLSLMSENELPKPKVGIVFIPKSEAESIKDALMLLEKQNDLETGMWKILSAKDEKDGFTAALSIDEASIRILRTLEFRPRLGFKRVVIRIWGESIPTNVDGNPKPGTSSLATKTMPPQKTTPTGPQASESGTTSKRTNVARGPGNPALVKRPKGGPNKRAQSSKKGKARHVDTA
ncbi:unnamed protein product [Diatraea saccharalis]|uniref:DUF4780 domain-containing protein n=1 Tax=Diatraea saccharalis TaxID=40085 RepID=A0A9N9R601_9NEOP|nr:unnamed protein product [Diatraea saccharalis]